MELRFAGRFGARPDGVWSAPGRVNLIGEHTDYNQGLVLPMAIDLECLTVAGRRDDGQLRVHSEQLGDGGAVSLAERRPESLLPWVRYVAGVAWALIDDGVPVPGADLLISSAVPAGAGLSSSAALECSVGLALCDLAGVDVAPMRLALASQRAETDVVGAPVGVMDQVASAYGSSEGPVLLDCRSLEVRTVPLSLEGAGLVLVVIDTQVTHAHATGGYGARRAECEQAAALLGLASLRDATLEQTEQLPDVLRRRARHVVTENARVLEVVSALERRDMSALGPLLAAGHASLRDDFEVSCTELDTAVAAALDAGAIAARMTGGGFGGSVVALVPEADLPGLAPVARAAAVAVGAPEPVLRVVRPARGARRLL